MTLWLGVWGLEIRTSLLDIEECRGLPNLKVHVQNYRPLTRATAGLNPESYVELLNTTTAAERPIALCAEQLFSWVFGRSS